MARPAPAAGNCGTVLHSVESGRHRCDLPSTRAGRAAARHPAALGASRALIQEGHMLRETCVPPCLQCFYGVKELRNALQGYADAPAVPPSGTQVRNPFYHPNAT